MGTSSEKKSVVMTSVCLCNDQFVSQQAPTPGSHHRCVFLENCILRVSLEHVSKFYANHFPSIQSRWFSWNSESDPLDREIQPFTSVRGMLPKWHSYWIMISKVDYCDVTIVSEKRMLVSELKTTSSQWEHDSFACEEIAVIILRGHQYLIARFLCCVAIWAGRVIIQSI